MENPRHLLASLRGRYNQRELAQQIGVSVRTLRRWEVGETDPQPYLADAIRQRLLPLANATARDDAAFTFIDLFAGIGGIRSGFERQGGRCVFTSEWNPWARKTYLANFPEATDTFVGDITQVDAQDIPDHDLLLAGFPCQPFSIAGVSKKNALGRKHGFADETQGTLFFDVVRIIKAKQPRAFLLENVKNLKSHDKGNTFRVIERTLKGLHYDIHVKVIDGQCFVPQHRERILIVGFREEADFTWDDLQLPKQGPRLASILHPQDGSESAEPPYTEGPKGKINPKYTLTPHLWQYLQDYAAKHRAAGNGFGFGLVDAQSVTRTLSARYYKDGSEILVSQGKRKRPRRLTPRECARLMGFPESFKIPVSDTQAYQLFAHAAVVPMIEAVAKCVIPKLRASGEMPVADAIKISSTAFPQTGRWTPEQTKLAFELYCQTPFGKLDARNKNIIELAKLLRRTPDAVAMKCLNIASIDPVVKASGKAGLGNASGLDREVWDEFHADWERLTLECNQLRQFLRHEAGAKAVPAGETTDDFVLDDYTGETRQAIVQQRIKQRFFRRAVLASYRGRCCISGVSDDRLLVASHIVPWREDKANRLNPSNGLCLSAIHDKAFDGHLFSLTDDNRIVLSQHLKASKDAFLQEVFWPIEDRVIDLPERFRPDPSFVFLHREAMLRGQA